MMKKLQGVTLLEAMLALAIASSIIVLGIRQYTQYKFVRDAFSLKYSVDGLFQGMRNYYYANCAESSDTNMQLHSLAPSRNPGNPFSVNIGSTLSSYLDPAWHPSFFLIDRSFGQSGYDVQFNNVTTTTLRNENFCYYYPGTTQTAPICASLPNTSASVSLWIAQIVVKVANTNETLAIKNLAGADCAVDKYQIGSIVDCSTGATTGTPVYLVWQRLPSFASPDMSSGLWRATSTGKEFNLQYTNDSYWEVSSGSQAYHLCGG